MRGGKPDLALSSPPIGNAGFKLFNDADEMMEEEISAKIQQCLSIEQME